MTLDFLQQAQPTGARTGPPASAHRGAEQVLRADATVDHAELQRCAASEVTGAMGTSRPAREIGRSVQHGVERGLTTVVPPLELHDRIQVAALTALNRFRVIRTFDIAAVCFPERAYKAALSAAQRAMRGLAKRGLVRRYVTDRHQHVYGLTERGAQLLREHDVDAASSIRRVNDMTNPEHLLWASFIVCCSESRGLRAETESELLRSLEKQYGRGHAKSRGLLQVHVDVGAKTLAHSLRPDAAGFEADGLTWFEIDRSLRGQERARSLAQLFGRVGAQLHNGIPLRRVVVFAKSARILERNLGLARTLVGDPSELRFGTRGRVALREVRDGVFEVWSEKALRHADGRSSFEPGMSGHIVIQMLPLHLPKVRIDGRTESPVEGWFPDNFLPYVRPETLGPWSHPVSPLLFT